MVEKRDYFILVLIELIILYCLMTNASLISSSEVQMCQRTSNAFEPILGNDACQKKFLVALAVRNGQGEAGSIFADIRTVDNKTGPVAKKEQLKKPFRISVSKSDVHVHYPVKYLFSVNNKPFEKSYSVRNIILGINKCRRRNCRSLKGYCCSSSRNEKLSRTWEYKRGVRRKVGHYHSHKYSQAICMGNDNLHYNVYEIGDPYLTYKINVTVQQLDYQERSYKKGKNQKLKDIWYTVGYAEIGPERMGQNTDQNQVGKTSGPKIKATWLGDFRLNTYSANFQSKYLLTPDWRASRKPSKTKYHEQVQGGSKEWLLIDRYLVDESGHTCNKIGVGLAAFRGQQNRCYQKENSCFQVTPRSIWEKAKELQTKKQPTHYFPSFYGDFQGPHHQTKTDHVKMKDKSPEEDKNFQLVYKSSEIHQSLVTLIFTADSISFVDNKSEGRIVEALIDDFTALAGSGLLFVIIQNTGSVTADFAVAVDQCTEGIIRISQRTQTINPRQQISFEFQISSSMNMNYNHSCNVELTDGEGRLLDIKRVNFKTEEGCIYCPAEQCTCSCTRPTEEEVEDEDTEENTECKEKNYLNPFWEPKVIVIKPCYHCWITDPLTHPVYATFIIVIILLCLGMTKMLILQSCCRTKDGRPIDVVGVILGTASAEHTKKKQRSATIQFLLGACFFVYFPILPLMIVFCNWRRKQLARKRLRKKAERKKQRLLRKKQAALTATQGLMVLGEGDSITMDDALKVFDKESKEANKPTVLIVSSSSDTDEQDFNYSTSSDTDIGAEVFGEDIEDELKPLKGKKRKRRKKKNKQ